MTHNIESIKKFFKSPGKCTLSQVEDTESFLKEYMEFRDLYREISGVEPTMYTLESKLMDIEWYKDFHSKNNEE